VPQNIALLKYR